MPDASKKDIPNNKTGSFIESSTSLHYKTGLKRGGDVDVEKNSKKASFGKNFKKDCKEEDTLIDKEDELAD